MKDPKTKSLNASESPPPQSYISNSCQTIAFQRQVVSKSEKYRFLQPKL